MLLHAVVITQIQTSQVTKSMKIFIQWVKMIALLLTFSYSHKKEIYISSHEKSRSKKIKADLAVMSVLEIWILAAPTGCLQRKYIYFAVQVPLDLLILFHSVTTHQDWDVRENANTRNSDFRWETIAKRGHSERGLREVVGESDCPPNE